MKSSIYNILERVTKEQVENQLAEYAKLNGLTLAKETDDTQRTISVPDAANRLEQAQEFMLAQFTGKDFKGERFDVPEIKIDEAMGTSDASIIFPRVINNVLLEPKEPILWLSNNVADTVTLPDGAPIYVEFPRTTALQAFDMSEGQDYPAQQLSVVQDMTSMRIRRVGLASSVTDDVIRQSMWPILALLMRMMAAAINRRVEENLYQAMIQKAQNVFDNNSTNNVYHTSGVDLSQNWNGSFGYDDLVKMLGVLLGNRYNATHFLAHPLAWPIFALDPILRATFYHGGQIGQGIWNRAPQFDQSAAIPFGLTYIPYYALTYTEQGSLTSAPQLGPSLVSDLYLIDKANSLYLAERGGIEMDQMDNWYRDSKQVKAKKYCGVASKDGGHGMISAKNIRIVKNQSSVMVVNTVTS